MSTDKSLLESPFDIKGIHIVYIIGLVIWLIMYPVFIYYHLRTSIYDPYFLWYIPPYVLGFMVMIWHIFQWRDIYKSPGYRTEVELIEFAERNTSYLILGISLLSYTVTREFFLLIALYCSILVLPLWWVSAEKKEHLAWLRHWKTIPYTYAICFSLAGLVSILQQCPSVK